MKRKQSKAALIVAFIIIVPIVLVIWYFTPRTFLNRVEASEVKSIYIFDGFYGKSFTINDPEEIKQIVQNIQSIEMKRDGRSLFYMGYRFYISFMDENEKEIDNFIMNSSDMIRDDPFFYRCDGGLCFDYLSELEDKYINHAAN